MEKYLYVEWFLSEEALINYVHLKGITKEDIQTIIHSNGRIYLYYWE